MRNRPQRHRRQGMGEQPMEPRPSPNYYDNYYRHHYWPRWWWYYYDNEYDYDWDYDLYDDDWYYFSKVYRQGVEHGRMQALKVASQSSCMPTEPPPPPPPSEPTKG